MTRPDYCPVAQAPCQAMCALSDVRCQIRDTQPTAQRKPLTDEKIWELAANCLDSVAGRLQFARAIEAAHGITGENT